MCFINQEVFAELFKITKDNSLIAWEIQFRFWWWGSIFVRITIHCCLILAVKLMLRPSMAQTWCTTTVSTWILGNHCFLSHLESSSPCNRDFWNFCLTSYWEKKWLPLSALCRLLFSVSTFWQCSLLFGHSFKRYVYPKRLKCDAKYCVKNHAKEFPKTLIKLFLYRNSIRNESNPQTKKL